VTFEPIAIVGRGCVLPGANTPAQFWNMIRDGRDLIAPAPEGHWRLDRGRVLRATGDADTAFTDAGGYVSGFDAVFDPAGFALPVERILELDPMFQWLLHAARQAQAEAGMFGRGIVRTGVIIGNLSLPTESFSRFAETVWLKEQGRSFLDGRAVELAGLREPAAENRFMSGLPAHIVARALGADGAAFCLDAACASSLYAVKLACDRLHAREADVMIAGGVNRADDLFLHTGFTALQALSRTGHSRPFNREADGLLPAEGAGCVVLERLADAEAAGRRVLGIIRGVGLSNDGRAGGVLRPDSDGQIRAMRAAYEQAGLDPRDISLVECHATGTRAGDTVEINSMRAVFGEAGDLPIGSHKSNFGHAITASGMAGLLKLLGALEEGVRPPTLHAAPAIDELSGTPLRLLHQAEAWPSAGPRLAAINGFGFGGNNAHLVLEEWQPARRVFAGQAPREPVAIVAIGACVGSDEGCEALARSLFGDASDLPRNAREVAVNAREARVPPDDLRAGLGQQLMMLRACQEAVREAGLLDAARTGTVIGFGCDPDSTRHGFRLRLPEWAQRWSAAGYPIDDAWVRAACDAAGAPLTSAFVVGRLPNMPANRLNAQFDWREFGYTVSSEELSGIVALRTAVAALRAGELDVAIIGAVDLSCDPVHEAAARAVLPAAHQQPGDGAVAFVLRRLSDARKLGGRIYAIIGDDDAPKSASLALDMDDASIVTARLGHVHAASGLLHVAAAALACAARARPPAAGVATRPWLPSAQGRIASTTIATFSGQRDTISLASDPHSTPIRLPGPAQWQLRVFAAGDVTRLRERIVAGKTGGDGAVRLAVVAREDAWDTRLAAALRALDERRSDTTGTLAPGIYFRDSAVGGGVGCVFTGAAAAYPGMGRDLLLALPDLADRACERCGLTPDVIAGLYETSPDAKMQPFDLLKGSTFLCQIHAELSRSLLGLQPEAAIGLSSGETNALFAFGAWNDMDPMLAEIAAAGLYETHLSGDFAAARTFWEDDTAPVAWRNWRVLAPVDAVNAALAGETRAHLIIVNTDTDCVIAGDAEATGRVVERIGRERCWPFAHDMIIHCPELAPFADAWRAIHQRTTTPVPGVRFYTHATGSHYALDTESVADALLLQARQTIDFRQTIEAAWADGIRVFVEHGPCDSLTAAISKILAGRPHIAVALDRPGRSSLEQVFHAAAQLYVAGVDVRLEGLAAALEAAQPPGAVPAGAMPDGTFTVPAHFAPVVLPPLPARDDDAGDARGEIMVPAPQLPPIMEFARFTAGVAAASAPSDDGHPIAILLAQASAQHQTFIAEQSRLHQIFLGLLGPAPAQLPGPAPEQLPAPAPAQSPPRLQLNRAELEIHAAGRISTIFGPLFREQDDFALQVRMPSPPLLFVDRVTDISGEPGSMGRGTVWTETDVAEGAWYLHQGRMSPGIVVESGQADLLLISWLGVDFRNRGERAYRLLGCELTFQGDMPEPGDTLVFDIHVDSHARSGEVGLFFFHYDCHVGDRLVLSVRNGQAGFFTREELAASGGVLWSPEDDEPNAAARLDAAPRLTSRRAFGPELVRAFAAGNAYECFGDGFELAAAHQRTPTIPSGRLSPFDEVTAFEPQGGPWGRGYLRAEALISPEQWFYAGHFANDPCMPGTLMADAAAQAMAFYLAALGFTIERDSWRFIPVPGATSTLICRGQVIPDAPHRLTYEVFVEEIIAGPQPTIYAALLCTSDGLKVFHCRSFGVTLVPDWPLPERHALIAGVEPHLVRPDSDIRGDYAALLACAWGAPSEAFGSMFRAFDGGRRVPRLPGPPFHFMSRVTDVDCPPGRPVIGATMECVYDVAPDAWFFAENGAAVMPLCVLLECMLQPCGWFGSYLGLAANAPREVFFRNLDGDDAAQRAEVTPTSGALTVRLTVTKMANLGATSLVFLHVESHVGDRALIALDTSFAFVEADALKRQSGLPSTDREREALTEPSTVHIDLTALPPELFSGSLRLAGGRLRMLDEITGLWPADGQKSAGRIRGRQSVDPHAWYFKAHFFQDPVQPGSLGVEALVQLLQAWMLLSGHGRDLVAPRFQAIALDERFAWKYRGQVLPDTREVVTMVDVVRVVEEPTGVLAVAKASLWADGMKIYEVDNLSMRIVSDAN
jgi:acyl transferase domain-containing protein/3-hydroxymyristoyl/3-hydroxydecanoyl-(acyl carrier protein) dehydratase